MRPDVAVVTVIGDDHYKAFRGREAVAREKGALVEALPAHGVAVLNADDPALHGLASRTRRVLSFGESEGSAVRSSRSTTCRSSCATR